MIPIYRYTEKKRDSNNTIKQYILEDIHTHQTYTVNKDELKTKMTSNQVRITNLQIDSQGRLVDKQETTSNQHPNLQSQSRNPADSMIPYVAHCADRRRRSGAQTSATEVERSRTGRRSVRAQWRTPPEGEVRV